jgi:glutamate-1-semialdehyde 2,1-aminomutase
VFWIHPKSKFPLRNLSTLASNVNELYGELFHKLLSKGIYLAPSGYEVGFISLAHTPEVLAEALKRIQEAVSELV